MTPSPMTTYARVFLLPLIALCLGVLPPVSVQAQSFDLGATLTNRYV